MGNGASSGDSLLGDDLLLSPSDGGPVPACEGAPTPCRCYRYAWDEAARAFVRRDCDPADAEVRALQREVATGEEPEYGSPSLSRFDLPDNGGRLHYGVHGDTYVFVGPGGREPPEAVPAALVRLVATLARWDALCVVCQHRLCRTTLRPCQHRAVCDHCLMRMGTNRCPLCRTPFEPWPVTFAALGLRPPPVIRNRGDLEGAVRHALEMRVADRAPDVLAGGLYQEAEREILDRELRFLRWRAGTGAGPGGPLPAELLGPTASSTAPRRLAGLILLEVIQGGAPARESFPPVVPLAYWIWDVVTRLHPAYGTVAGWLTDDAVLRGAVLLSQDTRDGSELSPEAWANAILYGECVRAAHWALSLAQDAGRDAGEFLAAAAHADPIVAEVLPCWCAVLLARVADLQGVLIARHGEAAYQGMGNRLHRLVRQLREPGAADWRPRGAALPPPPGSEARPADPEAGRTPRRPRTPSSDPSSRRPTRRRRGTGPEPAPGPEQWPDNTPSPGLEDLRQRVEGRLSRRGGRSTQDHRRARQHIVRMLHMLADDPAGRWLGTDQGGGPSMRSQLADHVVTETSGRRPPGSAAPVTQDLVDGVLEAVMERVGPQRRSMPVGWQAPLEFVCRLQYAVFRRRRPEDLTEFVTRRMARIADVVVADLRLGEGWPQDDDVDDDGHRPLWTHLTARVVGSLSGPLRGLPEAERVWVEDHVALLAHLFETPGGGEAWLAHLNPYQREAVVHIVQGQVRLSERRYALLWSPVWVPSAEARRWVDANRPLVGATGAEARAAWDSAVEDVIHVAAHVLITLCSECSVGQFVSARRDRVASTARALVSKRLAVGP